MIRLRAADERGHANHGWLEAYHTFSFADYQDPENMGFSVLRVMNEDRVAPGKGFGTHPHRNMEIITYVISGELEHKDSMGNGSVISAGEFQYLSAGKGITHSEFNPSNENETHLYQIWIVPEKTGLSPTYEQRTFELEESENGLVLIASPDGRARSITIRQDASLYLGKLDAEKYLELPLSEERQGWLQIVSGEAELNGHQLAVSDGAAISAESNLRIHSHSGAKFLFFDLP